MAVGLEPLGSTLASATTELWDDQYSPLKLLPAGQQQQQLAKSPADDLLENLLQCYEHNDFSTAYVATDADFAAFAAALSADQPGTAFTADTPALQPAVAAVSSCPEGLCVDPRSLQLISTQDPAILGQPVGPSAAADTPTPCPVNITGPGPSTVPGQHSTDAVPARATAATRQHRVTVSASAPNLHLLTRGGVRRSSSAGRADGRWQAARRPVDYDTAKKQQLLTLEQEVSSLTEIHNNLTERKSTLSQANAVLSARLSELQSKVAMSQALNSRLREDNIPLRAAVGSISQLQRDLQLAQQQQQQQQQQAQGCRTLTAGQLQQQQGSQCDLMMQQQQTCVGQGVSPQRALVPQQQRQLAYPVQQQQHPYVIPLLQQQQQQQQQQQLQWQQPQQASLVQQQPQQALLLQCQPRPVPLVRQMLGSELQQQQPQQMLLQGWSNMPQQHGSTAAAAACTAAGVRDPDSYMQLLSGTGLQQPGFSTDWPL